MNNVGRTNMQADQGGGATGSAGDNSWPKWLKISGIGCAVLLLVGGILLALAVFRTAACCSEFGEFAEVLEEVQVETHSSAAALHVGDYQQFYDDLDPAVQETVSVADIEAEFEEFRTYLDASQPFPIRVDLDQEEFDLMNVGEMDQFEVLTHFGEPQYRERLQVRLFVEATMEETDGDEPAVDLRIIDWEAFVEEADFAESRYAQTAQRFHDRIERGDFQNAHHMLVPGLDEGLAALNQEEFSAEMEAISERLAAMDRADIQGVYPHDYVDTITVRMLLVDDGEPYFIDYLVNWQDQVLDVSDVEPAGVPLADIDPEADDEADDEADEVDEPSEEDGEDDQESDDDGDSGDD